MTVLGEPIDMQKVKVDAYIVAGITDHITPWRACYETARIYGSNSEFMLANAGHLQSMLNPPGSPKSFFFTAKVGGPGRRRLGRRRHAARGQLVAALDGLDAAALRRAGAHATKLGSRKHPPGVPAPGEYVMVP